MPQGWTESRETLDYGERVEFDDPASSAFLRIEQTAEPAADALVDWQENEPAVAGRLGNYQRVRLERVEVPYAADAADWEFTYGRGTHVLNRNLRVSDDRAYALYWSAPDSAWAQSRPVFDQVASTFVPAG